MKNPERQALLTFTSLRLFALRDILAA